VGDFIRGEERRHHPHIKVLAFIGTRVGAGGSEGILQKT